MGGLHRHRVSVNVSCSFRLRAPRPLMGGLHKHRTVSGDPVVVCLARWEVTAGVRCSSMVPRLGGKTRFNGGSVKVSRQNVD